MHRKSTPLPSLLNSLVKAQDDAPIHPSYHPVPPYPVLPKKMPSSSLPTPTLWRNVDLIYREKGWGFHAESKPHCMELIDRTDTECTIVCYCFTYGIMNLLFLAMVMLPAGLCWRAIRKRRMRKRKSQNVALLAHGVWRDEDYEGSYTPRARRLLTVTFGVVLSLVDHNTTCIGG